VSDDPLDDLVADRRRRGDLLGYALDHDEHEVLLFVPDDAEPEPFPDAVAGWDVRVIRLPRPDDPGDH
jgi:hypothetical protein